MKKKTFLVTGGTGFIGSNISKLLVKKNTKGWVNCTARLWPFYRKLREEIISEKRIKIGVSGSNWALASNTIHFIDLLAFLN